MPRYRRRSGLATALLLLTLAASVKQSSAAKENYGTVIGIDLGTTYSWFVVIFCIINYYLVIHFYHGSSTKIFKLS